MAKSTSGGTGRTKSEAGAVKSRRAPVRRRTVKKTTDSPIAVASELAASTQVAPVAAAAGVADLNYDEVARRAYEIYCGRGGANGSAVDDWLEAERQLRHQHRTH
jgi:hypothetical protein